MMRKKFIHTHWLPVAVVLFGVLGAVLFAWTNHINEKQRVNYLLLDAIMDVQIRTSTFHLWFEQVLAGDTRVDMKEVWEDHERAVKLVDVVMNGGQSEHGLISLPLNDRGMRSQAEKIKSMLASLKTIGMVRMQQPSKAGIGSDVDHRFDDVFGKILANATGLKLVVQNEKLFMKDFRAKTAVVTEQPFAETLDATAVVSGRPDHMAILSAPSASRIFPTTPATKPPTRSSATTEDSLLFRWRNRLRTQVLATEFSCTTLRRRQRVRNSKTVDHG